MIIEISVPAAGESITEATVGSVVAKNGSYVHEDDVILELETDKANLPLIAPKAGQLELLVAEGDDVLVGQVIAKINSDVAPVDQPKTSEKETKSEPKVATKTESKPSTFSQSETLVLPKKQSASGKNVAPSANKLMAENNIQPAHVFGTGKGGRITRADVINQIKNPAPPVHSFGGFPEPPNLGYVAPEPEPIKGERETRKKMSRLRRVIAKKLVEAKNETAMLTTFNEVNMQRIMALRGQYKEKFKEIHGVNLGFMSFFIKAASEALKTFPDVNAYIEDEDIVYRNYIDISVAVGTPRGLVVPVLRNCDKLSFHGIEKKISDFALRGREGTLEISEMEGGGFTISNGGVYGSLLSTPIVNAPQSAILGMHSIQERPIAIKGEIKIAPMMYLALSYDHRIIDGKEAVSFLVKIKELIEDPAGLLFDI